MVFDYLDAGADDEISLRRGKDAYSELEMHYHVLSGPPPPRPPNTTEPSTASPPSRPRASRRSARSTAGPEHEGVRAGREAPLLRLPYRRQP